MYKIESTRAYRKAFKRISRHKDINLDLLNEIIDTLARGEKLDPKHRDHQLKGEFKDHRECHVQNDVLLMYQKHDKVLILLLVDLGSHSELF